MTTHKYWYREPLDDVLTVATPEMLRDAIYLLIDNKIITRDSFLNTSGFLPADLKSICGLPDEFFSGYNQRIKPILRIV